MKAFMMKKQLAILLVSIPMLVFAGVQDDAKKVIEHRLAMGFPGDDFQKWQIDQWRWAARDCAEHANISLPEGWDTMRVHFGGLHVSSKDIGSLCSLLAAGPSPKCYGFMSRHSPFTRPPEGLPATYAFLDTINAGSTYSRVVTVKGRCELVAGHPETQQLYIGPAIVTSIEKPTLKPVLVSSGLLNFNVGTIAFEVEGYAEKSVVLVVIND